MYSVFFFLMIRRPPRSTLDRSSAASDVYKRQVVLLQRAGRVRVPVPVDVVDDELLVALHPDALDLSLIHISEPTRPY